MAYFMFCFVVDFTRLSRTLRVSDVVASHTMAPLYEVCCMLYDGCYMLLPLFCTSEMPCCCYSGGEIPPMIITAGINTWAGSGLEIVPNYYHYRDGHYSRIWINCFITINSICHNICNARRCCRLRYQEEKRDEFWWDCWVYLCNIIPGFHLIQTISPPHFLPTPDTSQSLPPDYWRTQIQWVCSFYLYLQ